jgi:arylsulfatase A-like enzyme
MGFQTPNIDRIGKEGALFLSWYAQQSCTAGRAAFITGQSPIRTGLTKVGMPGRTSACGRTGAARRHVPCCVGGFEKASRVVQHIRGDLHYLV